MAKKRMNDESESPWAWKGARAPQRASDTYTKSKFCYKEEAEESAIWLNTETLFSTHSVSRWYTRFHPRASLHL